MVPIKPLKLRMYENVYRLNQNFEEVMRDLKTLQDLQVFPQRFLRACQERAEQLRADANHELTRVLNMCEAGDSAHFAHVLSRQQRRTARARAAMRARVRKPGKRRRKG